MKVFSQKALQNVLSQLSAMRVVLTDDEQAILDAIITRSSFAFSSDEVAAQTLLIRGADQQVATDADEVAAQSYNMRNVNTAVNFDADDAAAKAAAMRSANMAVQKRVNTAIAFDPEQAIYTTQVIK